MGVLLHTRTRREHWLGSRHLVGRMDSAHLCLPESWVSGSHASIRWTGQGWELRDLASRNGTFLDGRRIEPGERILLEPGARIAFGREEETWELADDGPPEAYAISDVGQVSGEDDVIGLPDADDPSVFIYSTETGWFVVYPDQEIRAVMDGEVIEVDGQLWTLSLPRPVLETRDVWSQMRPEQVTLGFQVARNGEEVHIELNSPSGQLKLEHRVHHHLLHRLAQVRHAHRADGVSLPEQGWVSVQELADDLGVKISHLNMNIYRARQQFGKLGLHPADAIVERRRGTGQLRLGVAKVELRN